MSNAYFNLALPNNEPIKHYAPGSPERAELTSAIAWMKARDVEIPLLIGGKEVRTGAMGDMHAPHNHALKLGTYHKAGAKEVAMAVEASLKAQKTWSTMPWEHRVGIFLKAADL